MRFVVDLFLICMRLFVIFVGRIVMLGVVVHGVMASESVTVPVEVLEINISDVFSCSKSSWTKKISNLILELVWNHLTYLIHKLLGFFFPVFLHLFIVSHFLRSVSISLFMSLLGFLWKFIRDRVPEIEFFIYWVHFWFRSRLWCWLRDGLTNSLWDLNLHRWWKWNILLVLSEGMVRLLWFMVLLMFHVHFMWWLWNNNWRLALWRRLVAMSIDEVILLVDILVNHVELEVLGVHERKETNQGHKTDDFQEFLFEHFHVL